MYISILLAGTHLRTVLTDFDVTAVLQNQADRRMTNVENLTVAELKDELQQRNLPIKGKKPDLIVRLKQVIGNNTQVSSCPHIVMTVYKHRATTLQHIMTC